MICSSIEENKWNLEAWVLFFQSECEINESSRQEAEEYPIIFDIYCSVICGENCDEESDRKTRINNMFDFTESEWWCPADNARLYIRKF